MYICFEQMYMFFFVFQMETKDRKMFSISAEKAGISVKNSKENSIL